MPAPNKDERAKCWAARDDYWACLENNAENKSKCTEFRKMFEESCTKTWLKYFDRRRDYLKYKAKMEQGYEPLEESKKT